MAPKKDHTPGIVASGTNRDQHGLDNDYGLQIAEIRKALGDPAIRASEKQLLRQQLDEIESAHRQKKMNAFFSLC